MTIVWPRLHGFYSILLTDTARQPNTRTVQGEGAHCSHNIAYRPPSLTNSSTRSSPADIYSYEYDLPPSGLGEPSSASIYSALNIAKLSQSSFWPLRNVDKLKLHLGDEPSRASRCGQRIG